MGTIVSILPLVEFVRPMTFTLPLWNCRNAGVSVSAVGCRRALAHFSVCDCCLPPAKPHQLARTNSSYDCNRNGNRAEMLRVCTVRPLSPTLRGSKGGVSSNLIGSNVLAGCWLGLISRGLREGEEEKLDFFRWNLALWWACPTNNSFSMLWLGLLSRGLRGGEEKLDIFRWNFLLHIRILCRILP